MVDSIKYIRLWCKQLICDHKKWDSDTQIRTIRCRSCGKEAWIEEYKSLYSK